MTPLDLTVPVDDMLCERHRVCFLCGSKAPRWMDIRLYTHGAWCVGLCVRCYDRDHGWTEVDAVLAQRHG